MNSNLATLRFIPWFSQGFSQAALLALLSIGGTAPGVLAADVAVTAANGVITGTVSNLTTGNLLEGARVELPQLGLSTLVDATGRFVISGVPAGTHEIAVSYSGLDPQKGTITVAAGQRATRDFDLTSGIYRLDAFKVAGEREGNAAAITAQRNADNVKNVVSMDAYGNLPNMNATELAIRLPGVSFGNPGDEVVESISVRGMGPGMSTVTIDGGLLSGMGGTNRQARMTAFTGAMFESIEVIKGHTPDKGADSLGGTVNFKSRSPLSMREKRRFSYTLSARQAPWFTEQIPLREAHRTHPLFNASYQEKFRAFGSGEENLAVSVNAFYSENVFGFFRTIRDYQRTSSTPAYLWDYRTDDDYNNRTQMSVNTKFDFRLSPNTKLTLNVIYSDAPEPARRHYVTRAFAGSATTTPSATSGIVPGAFTDRITVVRAVPTPSNATPASTPAAVIDASSTVFERNQRLRHMDIGGEHIFGPLELDWAVLWSRTRYRTLGAEASLTNRIGGIPVIGPNGQPGTPTNTIVGPNGETGVGWILDRTKDELYPQFIQNGGLDFTNPNNYRPTQNGLQSNAGNLKQHLIRDVRGNAKYKLPFESFTVFLKTGGDLREQAATDTGSRRRWSYIGTTALPTDPSVLTWDKVKTGRNIPVWESAAYVQNGQPTNPALWSEDRYFHEQTNFTGADNVKETVTAAYIMTQGKFGNNGFLTGVRGEKTDTESYGWVRARVPSTAAQQIADPVGSAQRDYAGNFRVREGSYRDYFPSIHLYRNFTPNLKGRASWSTSFGRPSMDNALPTETVNETARTLTIGNPALLPQTAKNWDLTAEYYFEPSGSFTVGWFHKTIKDYIVTGQIGETIGTGTDNGYNGEYGGFTTLMSLNAGLAIAQGWEFSYVQQFRFLPGIWKGLSLNANLTIINTHGDFGTTSYLGNNQVEGFIPKTSNVSLSWNYRKFGTRVLYNYSSEHIRAFNSAQPSRNQFMMAREIVNLGFTYILRPNLTLQLDIANLFNEPQKYYRSIPDQLETFLMQGTTITAGVQGRF